MMALKVKDIDSYKDLEAYAKSLKVVFSITDWTNEVWLNKIIVPKELRGQHIGSNLIKEVIRLAGNRTVKLLASNCYGTELETLKNFYRHLGFKSYIEKGYKCKDYMRYDPV